MNKDSTHTPNFEVDPKMQRLLDAALKPEAPPEGLTNRIVAATQDKLGAPRPVLGRIGPVRLMRAAAVAVAAALTVVIWLGLNPGDTEPQVNDLAALNQWLDEFEVSGELDPELQILETELAQSESALESEFDLIDQVLIEWELDRSGEDDTVMF